ncbi:MAG: hypothetical protein UW70_C0065G0006, partial [Candidatus Peregrinibacteria bacterium GW2011_GWA2_44_7]
MSNRPGLPIPKPTRRHKKSHSLRILNNILANNVSDLPAGRQGGGGSGPTWWERLCRLEGA